MTESMRPVGWRTRTDLIPVALLVLTAALVGRESRLAVALALQALALAFWLWARRAGTPEANCARWVWLHRPALAMWFAFGFEQALPAAPTPLVPFAGAPPVLGQALPAFVADPHAPLRALAALAVVWAGMELLAATPASRVMPDLAGPRAGVAGLLPALPPLAGFLVLWSQRTAWLTAPLLAELLSIALLIAAAVAALRAHARRSMSAAWRWLVVWDGALAGLALAQRVLPADTLLVLWLAAAGGHALALAGESLGAVARRGAGTAAAWRIAGAVSGALLAFPLLASLAFRGGRAMPVETLLVSAPVALAMWVSVHRVVALPERRATHRSTGWSGLAWVVAGLVALAGPLALLSAWWRGYAVEPGAAAIALLPLLAPLALRPRAGERAGSAPSVRGRGTAASVFRVVVALERRLLTTLAAGTRAAIAPLRDLHTGHAQEYLLFLTGVAVLALLLPLFR